MLGLLPSPNPPSRAGSEDSRSPSRPEFEWVALPHGTLHPRLILSYRILSYSHACLAPLKNVPAFKELTIYWHGHEINTKESSFFSLRPTSSEPLTASVFREAGPKILMFKVLFCVHCDYQAQFKVASIIIPVLQLKERELKRDEYPKSGTACEGDWARVGLPAGVWTQSCILGSRCRLPSAPRDFLKHLVKGFRLNEQK